MATDNLMVVESIYRQYTTRSGAVEGVITRLGKVSPMSGPNNTPGDVPDAAAVQRRLVQRRLVQRRDDRLKQWGMRGWYLVGIFLAVSFAFGLVGAISGLVIPLVVAMVVGVLFVPTVDQLARKMPRLAASGMVLILLSAAIAASVYLTVAGLVDHAPEIGRQLASGVNEVASRVGHTSIDPTTGEHTVAGFARLGAALRRGVAGNLGTVFSTTASFLAGTFVAAILLFFILHDWPRLSSWGAGHLGVSDDTGADIVDDATWSLRQYFMALTISSLIVATIVATTAVILGVPLVIAISLVTFFTSYIPYIGALLSGSFAVLIALGSGGVVDAVIILVVVLVAQNIVQTVVQTKLSRDRLALHPIVIFGSTIAGGATFGLLGAALSTPVTALLVRINMRLDATRSEEAEEAVNADGAQASM